MTGDEVELRYEEAIAVLQTWAGRRVRHETLIDGQPHGRAYEGVLVDLTDEHTHVPVGTAIVGVSEQPGDLEAINPGGAAFALSPSEHRGATRRSGPATTELSTLQGVWTWRWILLEA